MFEGWEVRRTREQGGCVNRWMTMPFHTEAPVSLSLSPTLWTQAQALNGPCCARRTAHRVDQRLCDGSSQSSQLLWVHRFAKRYVRFSLNQHPWRTVSGEWHGSSGSSARGLVPMLFGLPRCCDKGDSWRSWSRQQASSRYGGWWQRSPC